MTSRKLFEKFAVGHGLAVGRLQEVTRDGPKWAAYFDHMTQMCWLAWTASRRKPRQEIQK